MSKRRGSGEGSIHKRADGRWAGVVDLGWEGGRRKRKYVYARTRAEAASKLGEMLRRVQQGAPLSSDRTKLDDFLRQWILEVVQPSDLSPRTKASYADEVRLHISPALGGIALTKLTPQHIQRFVNAQREGGYAARSIQYRHAILRRALGLAESWGLVARNVAKLVPQIAAKSDSAKVHGLDPDDLRRLLAAARSDRLYALLLLTATTGLRRGEVLGLRWSDIDLDRGVVRVEQTVQRVPRRGLVVGPPKTGSSRRTNELASQVVAALRQHRKDQMRLRLRVPTWRDMDLVFPSAIGTPMEPRNLNRHMHALCRRAGLDPERFHNLRHTAASVAYAEGLDSKMVQAMLGHARYSTTADMYTHLTPALRREAAQRIADAME